MIINRIRSEHVLKYAELDLNHLPPGGLIAVSGLNESGKSTIGEIVCFALFGRTFSLRPDEIVKIIRWDEPRGSASVDFSINDERYCVSRFLDDNGTQGARLSKIGDDTPLARGVDAVHEALADLIGFSFDEFIESFYLAQREITTPHPHSTAVKRMAGIAALERVTTVAELEIDHEHTSIAATQALIDDLETIRSELEFDDARLPQLESEHKAKTAEQAQERRQVAELEAAVALYEDTATRVATAIKPVADLSDQSSFQDWKTRVSALENELSAIDQPHPDAATLSPGDLIVFVQSTQARLEGFHPIKDRAGLYRDHLAYLLSERRERPVTAPDVKPLADQQAELSQDFDAATRSRRTARLGFTFLLILAIVGWALWGLLVAAADAQIFQHLSDWLQHTVGNGPFSAPSIMASAAAILTLGAMLWGLRSRRLQAKIGHLHHSSNDVETERRMAQREAEAIDHLDTMPFAQAVDALERMRDPAIGHLVRMCRRDAGAVCLDTDAIDTMRRTLESLASAQNTRLQGACEQMTHTASSVNANMARRQTELEALGKSLEQERERRQKVDELEAIIKGHQRQIASHERRIEARRLACDLIEGGCRHIAKMFNRDVRGLVSRTLPLLTEGRYEHLKIDDNLNVQVFSSVKRDFMNLEEISSGTQRQIMLAVRLALSQEFINTTLERHQFIFLDEPFAFFDQERTRAALQALPELSHDLRQIWIVAQEFPENFPFDAHVRCKKELDRLTWSATST
ncbi:MAG: AAA family ATPase [Candidatus Tectomicrobia bacterium]|nr:AAA family ATPase [Candidatus Tectomicrobia bacterium]